jgi:hypothetical protein
MTQNNQRRSGQNLTNSQADDFHHRPPKLMRETERKDSRKQRDNPNKKHPEIDKQQRTQQFPSSHVDLEHKSCQIEQTRYDEDRHIADTFGIVG